MAISFRNVTKWLAEHGGALSEDDFRQLEDLVYQCREQVQARANEDRKELEELAKRKGKTLDEMLRSAGVVPTPVQPKKVAKFRRPYLNPYAPREQLYALYEGDPRRPLEPWAQQLKELPGAAAWAKEDFHYTKVQTEFDLREGSGEWMRRYKATAEEIFHELHAAELAERPRNSRNQKRKQA